MSATIDERVVEMKFDNSNFEKNVQVSMSTLEELKKALDFTKSTESLETIAKATKNVSFEAMADSIEAIEHRFSTMGIVGMTVIQNLTTSAMRLGTKIITAIPSQIAHGGWQRAMNVEEAKFQLEGLGVAWEEVADDIDHAVAGTAYGADAAAKAASILAASGVKYGGVVETLADGTEVYSDMGRALRGISGVAAMTNREYSDIANIFGTVAGQGKLMTFQLRQLEHSGLNVAANLGKVWGKTETEVRDMVTKGEISFQDFADAMDVAFGEHATKANDTLNGSMANMRAALSRIGQDFSQTIIQQTPQVFNSLKNFFNKIRTFTKPFADEIFTPAFTNMMKIVSTAINKITESIPDISKMDKEVLKSTKYFQAAQYMISGVTTIMSSLLLALDPIRKAFRETFNTSMADRIYNFAKKFNIFANKLIMSENTAKALQSIFKGLFSVIKLGLSIITKVIWVLSPLLRIVIAIAGALIRIGGVISNFIASIANAITGSKSFNNAFQVMHDVVEIFAIVLSKIISILGELSSSLLAVASNKILNFFLDLGRAFAAWADKVDLANKVFKVFLGLLLIPTVAIAALVYGIYSLIKAVSQLPIVQTIFATIKNTLVNMASFVKTVVSAIATGVSKVISAVKNFSITDFFAKVKTTFQNVLKAIEDFFVRISGGTDKVEKFKERVKSLIDTIIAFKDKLFGVGGGIRKAFEDPIIKAGDTSKSLKDILTELISRFIEFTKTLDVNKIVVGVYTLTMFSLMKNLTDMTKAFTGIAGAASGVFKSVSGFINSWKRKQETKLETAAKAIVLLAAALAILANVDQDALKSATILMSAFLGVVLLFIAAITGLSAAMKKGKLETGFKAIIATLMSLSVVMIALAVAMKILETVKVTEDLVAALSLVGAAIMLIMGVAIVVSKFSGKATIKSFLSLLSFSIALIAIAKALQMISTISWDNITNNMEAVLTTMGVLALLAILASHVGLFSAPGLLLMVFTLNKITPGLIELADNADKFDAILEVLHKYEDVVKVIGVVALAITAVSAAFGKGFAKFGLGMMLLSVSFLILEGAIVALSKIKPNEIERAMGVIVKVYALYAVIGLILSIGKGGQHAVKIAAAIGVLTLCLYAIAGAVYILGRMGAVEVKQGVRAVSAVLLSFAAIVGAASLGNNQMKVGTVLAIVLGLVAIISEMIVLTFIPYTELIKSTISISLVMIAFAKVIRSLQGKYEKLPTGTLRALLIFIPLIAMIGAALYIVGKYKWAQLAASGVGIKLVLKGIAKVFQTLDKMKKDKIDKSVIKAIQGIAIAMIPMGAALAIAATQPWYRILASSIAINAVLKQTAKTIVSLAKTLPASDYSKFKEIAKAMVLASLSIVAIGGALALTATQPWGNILVSGIAISMVMASFRKTLVAINDMENFNAAKAAALLVASLSVVAIGAGLALAATQPWGNILVAMIAIDVVMLVFNGLIKTLSNINFKPSSLIVVGEAIVMLLAVVGSLWALMALNEKYGGGIMDAMKSLCGVLLSLMGAVALASVLGVGSIVGALAGLVAIGIFVAGFIGIVNMVGEYFNNLENGQYEKIMTGCAMLSQLGASIGDAIGNFIGGVLKGITTNLPEAALSLSEFAMNLQPFISGIKNIDRNTVRGALYASAVLAIMAGGELLQGLVSMFTGNDMSKTADGMKSMGEGIASFASVTQGLDGMNLEGVAEATSILVKSIGGLAVGNLADAFVGFLTGHKNLNGLGDQFISFGEAIVGFAQTTEGLTKDSVEGAVNAGSAIAGLLHALPNQGGLLGKIVGNNNVEFFTQKNGGKYVLSEFGSAIKWFAVACKDVTAGSTDGAMDVAEKLFSLKLPNEGGKLADFVGDNNFEKFTPEIMWKFGYAILSFVNACQGNESWNIDGAIDVANKLFALDPPNEGGLIAGLMGDNTYERMGEELPIFGQGIADFADSVSSVDESKKQAIINAIDAIEAMYTRDFANMFSQIIGVNIQQTFDDASKFKDSMTTISEGLVLFHDNTADVNLYRLQQLMDTVKLLATTMSTISGNKASTIKNFKKAMEEAGALGIEGFLNAFSSSETMTNSENAVTAFLLHISGAITDKRNMLDNSINGFVTYVNGLIASEEHGLLFENSAVTLIGHFIAGIDQANEQAIASADGIVDTVVNEIISRVQEQSPYVWKAGFDLADRTDEGGFTTGVDAAQDTAVESGKGIVDATVTGINEEVQARSSALLELGKAALNDFITGYASKIPGLGPKLNNLWGAFERGEITLEYFREQVKLLAGDNELLGVGVDALFDKLQILSDEGIEGAAKSFLGIEDPAGAAAEAISGVGGAASKAKSEVEEFGDSLRQSLDSKTGGMSFFNKLELKAETSASAILENMKSNVDGVASWTARLQQLMARGLDKGLVKTLADAGLDSYDQIGAFLQMTDEQIAEANDLFLQAAAGRAYSAETITDGYFQLGKDNMLGLAKGTEKGTGEVVDAVEEANQAGLDKADEINGHHSPSKKWIELGRDDMLGYAIGIAEWANRPYMAIVEVCKRIRDVASELLSKDYFKSLGYYVVSGLAKGIEQNSKLAENAAKRMAEKVAAATADALEEKSPSRLAARLGKFFDMGLANGIEDGTSSVTAAASNLSKTVTDPLTSAFDEANTYVAKNLNLNPVIRPSLDLSNVYANAQSLNGLMESSRMAYSASLDTSWSNPSVRSKFMDELSGIVGTEYADRVVNAINNKDNRTNVYLEGDAAGVFKIVRRENRSFIKRTGYNGLA